MINKILKDITREDVQNLITNQIFESKILEYKAVLPGNSDQDKKEFLADVSSFANSDGGDIIYGIKQTKDKIESECGLTVANLDNEILRLDNLIRDGLSPRIDSETASIKTANNKDIIIIRIRPSLNAPHRVIFKNSNRFYKRGSNGKHEMDVSDLKSSFVSSSNLIEKIRDFRKQRIFDIKSNNGPVSLNNLETFITVHILPLLSFFTSSMLSNKQLSDMKDGKINFRPLYACSYNRRMNLDGVCAYDESKGVSLSYTQVFRDGKIEGFDSKMIP